MQLQWLAPVRHRHLVGTAGDFAGRLLGTNLSGSLIVDESIAQRLSSRYPKLGMFQHEGAGSSARWL
jgi:hypothetical protein